MSSASLSSSLMQGSRNIYIGVAWPYSYAAFHVGNLYGSHYPADIFARFHKMQGHNVTMVSGSDCHGTPITLKAEEEGIEPKALAEKYHQINVDLLKGLHIEYSLFTKTDTENHKHVVQEMFLELLEKGFILKKSTKQLYSEKEGKFLQDRYVEGICPFCKNDGARGDQCEKCGRVLDALDLISPRSKSTGDTLTIKETENYFLDLAKIQPQLETWLATKEGKWKKWILSETSGWFKEGLRERAITRDMSYGIALPHDRIPAEYKLSDNNEKVFYVWFEAVIGYLSATIEFAASNAAGNLQGRLTSWKEIWLTDTSAEHYYFVGEDNLVFHTINWPAQLLGTERGYNLPTNVFVNKFLLLEGDKISKSKNWIVDTRAMLDTYPLDSVRFYLAYIMTGDDQTNFLWEDFLNVNNGVFLAKIGNLINRVLSFTVKNFGTDFVGQGRECDLEIRTAIDEAFTITKEKFSQSRVREALLAIVKLAETGNEYLTKHEFWKLLKEDEKKCKDVVMNGLYIVQALRVLLYPIVPDFANAVHILLGNGDELHPTTGTDHWHFEGFTVDQKLAVEIAPLVTKFESTMVDEEKSKLGTKA